MSSSDDDDVDPQFKDVDRYYFEESKDKPVCFSVLPLQFADNDEVTYCDSKKVDLHGVADGTLHKVYKQVIAWRVWLHSEQPKISVLSTEGIWIELLRPRKWYEKTVRSILIIVQMLHFVKRGPARIKRSLLDHLCAVFNKFDNKPAEDDLWKQYPLIKLFAERDPILMKSKILQRFIKDSSGKLKEPKKCKHTEEPFIVSDEALASSDDDDDDYDNDDDNSNGGYNSNEDGNYNSSNDYCDDDDTDDDGHGTDPVCAICDNGGKLLRCVGRCKRSFHPRKEDGREANCDTLGYNSAQLKEIGTYQCKNCQYKQHQCFECGELEPSDGPNAKVFQCNNEFCGHFYHPKCVAKLLDPDDIDGACELEKRIVAGLSFTCPVHWCYECKSMEDRTQRALQLAMCRRCPRSYHIKCLPSEILFKKKLGISIRAWDLSKRIFIYCKCHDIVSAIGTPCRNHIKAPSIADIDQTRDLDKKIIKVLENPDMDTELDDDESFRDGKDEYDSETSLGKKIVIPIEEALHANQEQKDGQVILFAEKHAEGDQKNLMSRKDMNTHNIENVFDQDTISGQEKENSRSETRMRARWYEHDLGSGKERIRRSKDNESGSSNKEMTPDHVDDLSPERQVQVAYSTGTHLECGCDGDQGVDGSNTCQQKHKSPQCSADTKSTEIDSSDKIIKSREPNGKAIDSKRINSARSRENVQMKNASNRESVCDDEQEGDGNYTCQQELEHNSQQCITNNKATEIDTSGCSIKDKESNEKATGRKRGSLDRNRENVIKKNGRDACCEDKRTAHPQTHNSPQNLVRHKEPRVLGHKFRNKNFNSPWQNDDSRVAGPSEGRSRQRRSSRREESRNTNSMRANSYWDSSLDRNSYRNSSPMERRHGRKRSRDYSPDGQRMDNRDNYCRTNGRYRCNDHIDYHHDNSTDRRWRSPQRPAFSPSEYNADRRLRSPHRSAFSPDAFGDSGWRSSPFYARSEHGTNRRHNRHLYTRPEHVDQTDHSDSPYFGYDECYDTNYDGYYNVAYERQTNVGIRKHAEVYGECSDYGVGSGYPQKNRITREHRNLAKESVMDRYLPRLDETNRQISRLCKDLPYALPPARWRHGSYY